VSFELALLIIVAIVAIVVGLVCYHLLGRLERLERSVQGGLEPPTTRLSREQFERRFRTAHARSEIARTIGTGVLVVVGAEHTPDSDLAATIEHLPTRELVTITAVADIDAEALGITTTPYLFVVDADQVRTAQPVSNCSDVVNVLKRFA